MPPEPMASFSSPASRALWSNGHTLRRQGDLAVARREFEEALAIDTETGVKGAASETRLSLSRAEPAIHRDGDGCSKTPPPTPLLVFPKLIRQFRLRTIHWADA